MLTFEQLRAIANVIDYLAEEREDFAAFIERGGEPAQHIFHHVAVLENLLAESNN